MKQAGLLLELNIDDNSYLAEGSEENLMSAAKESYTRLKKKRLGPGAELSRLMKPSVLDSILMRTEQIVLGECTQVDAEDVKMYRPGLMIRASRLYYAMAMQGHPPEMSWQEYLKYEHGLDIMRSELLLKHEGTKQGSAEATEISRAIKKAKHLSGLLDTMLANGEYLGESQDANKIAEQVGTAVAELKAMYDKWNQLPAEKAGQTYAEICQKAMKGEIKWKQAEKKAKEKSYASARGTYAKDDVFNEIQALHNERVKMHEKAVDIKKRAEDHAKQVMACKDTLDGKLLRRSADRFYALAEEASEIGAETTRTELNESGDLLAGLASIRESADNPSQDISAEGLLQAAEYLMDLEKEVYELDDLARDVQQKLDKVKQADTQYKQISDMWSPYLRQYAGTDEEALYNAGARGLEEALSLAEQKIIYDVLSRAEDSLKDSGSERLGFHVVGKLLRKSENEMAILNRFYSGTVGGEACVLLASLAESFECLGDAENALQGGDTECATGILKRISDCKAGQVEPYASVYKRLCREKELLMQKINYVNIDNIDNKDERSEIKRETNTESHKIVLRNLEAGAAISELAEVSMQLSEDELRGFRRLGKRKLSQKERSRLKTKYRSSRRRASALLFNDL